MSLLTFLSDSLLIPEPVLNKFISTAPHRYKHYEIPKRSGRGVRKIAQPSKELKFIQKLLMGNLEPLIKIHYRAYAYRKGLSVKDNASLHKANPYLLKMDFKDFFPSITPNIFFQAMKKQGTSFSTEDCKLMEKVFFMKEPGSSEFILSIGAPSSPLISNVVMFEFDNNLDRLCIESEIVYSRYADDIVFSTQHKKRLFAIPDLVVKILNSEYSSSIVVNAGKTVFSSKAHNRHITGVTLTNDGKLSIGREKKRLLSARVHKYSLQQLSDELAINKLSGELSYAFFIEPSFKELLIRKYGEKVVESIMFRNLNS